MVHGDGSNSGLIANVNTLQSQMKMLMVLLSIVGTALGSILVATAIFIVNVLMD